MFILWQDWDNNAYEYNIWQQLKICAMQVQGTDKNGKVGSYKGPSLYVNHFTLKTFRQNNFVH